MHSLHLCVDRVPKVKHICTTCAHQDAYIISTGMYVNIHTHNTCTNVHTHMSHTHMHITHTHTYTTHTHTHMNVHIRIYTFCIAYCLSLQDLMPNLPVTMINNLQDSTQFDTAVHGHTITPPFCHLLSIYTTS